MLIVWLICAFGLISQSTTVAINTTQAAITAVTESAAESDLSDTILDLENAESKDSKKLEIIKQIRKINQDGTYTVGYESVDGTFQIQSRDVLGNVKGTYGYIDAKTGEIKRVSYTANNNTNGLKSTPQPVEEVVHIPRQNRTIYPSSTRRPASLAYLMSSTSSPAKANSNVVQAIPKRRILLASASQTASKNGQFTSTTRKSEFTTATSTQKSDQPTTTVVYATSVRSTASPSSTVRPATEQITKPDKIEISDRFSKVLNVNKDNKAVLDATEEKETKSERKPSIRGNALRRQLPSDQSENFEAQQQIVYSQSSDEDSAHTYTGVTGTQRPVFTTTSSPRIPALVLAARNRAALLKSQNAAHSTTTTTERVYSKPPRRKPERREEDEPVVTEPSSENYLTQSPVAVQIPANRDSVHPNAYLPRSREYLRQSQSANPVESSIGPRQYRLGIGQVQPGYEQEQYLRETTTAQSPEQDTSSDLNAVTQAEAFHHPRAARLQSPPQQGLSDGYEQQRLQQQPSHLPIQPSPFQPSPYGPSPYFNQPPYGHPDRPLTARDFERLLNLLVVRHQQYQRSNYLPGLFNQLGGYNQFGGYGYNQFGGYNPYGYQQIPRPPLYNQFDPRYTAFSRSLPPVPPPNSFYGPYSEQENQYMAQNPIEQQLPYMMPPRQRKIYNNQYYGGAQYGAQREFTDASQQKLQENGEYLPSEVREELLYRMLMLAIQPDPMASIPLPVPDASTMHEYIKSSAATSTPTPSKKPVRSVQILGEE